MDLGALVLPEDISQVGHARRYMPIHLHDMWWRRSTVTDHARCV